MLEYDRMDSLGMDDSIINVTDSHSGVSQALLEREFHVLFYHAIGSLGNVVEFVDSSHSAVDCCRSFAPHRSLHVGYSLFPEGTRDPSTFHA